jgi:putative ABC transport system ATP-binding protein
VRSYELDGISVPALRGVSLTVNPGDYLAIIGPSGSGKSTLMHLLGGWTGRRQVGCCWAVRDATTLSASELARLRNEVIGFVFQSFHLLARTSARDNVALPLIYRGLRRAERRRRAEEMLDRVGLAHRPASSAEPALGRRTTTGGHRSRSRDRTIGAPRR